MPVACLVGTPNGTSGCGSPVLREGVDPGYWPEGVYNLGSSADEVATGAGCPCTAALKLGGPAAALAKAGENVYLGASFAEAPGDTDNSFWELTEVKLSVSPAAVVGGTRSGPWARADDLTAQS